jgi:hypothetical protein
VGNHITGNLGSLECNETTQAQEVAYSHDMTAFLLKERVYA